MTISLRVWLFLTLGFLGSSLMADEAIDEAVESDSEVIEEQAIDVMESPVEDASLATPNEENLAQKPLNRSVKVYRIPVEGAIHKPLEFIVRRSIKEAIANQIDVLVIDMDTPGGRLDVTLEVVEMLNRFEGDTITFVNKDAISAGAYISMATEKIYFAPDGVMGAAAVVNSTGQEIDESMKAKINSYLFARMRSYTEQYPYRADVIRAMGDMDYEWTIGDKIIKKEGELLSLTATEAIETYGDPPKPLLADGIAEDLDALLSQVYGEDNFTVESFEITWSEKLAQYMAIVSPIFMGIGLLALFIEFKTPGFGIFGISGLVLIGIVFASNYIVGLAGYEAFIIFFLGLVLIAVDIFLIPGTFFFLIIGLLMVLGSLIWSLSDIWPTQPNDPDAPSWGFTVEADSVWNALYQTLGGFAIAVVGIMILWRFLPSTPLYRHLVLETASPSANPINAGGGSFRAGQKKLPDLGEIGIVVQPMHPVGKIEIDGHQYEASVKVGSLTKGTKVVVVGYGSFALIVERKES